MEGGRFSSSSSSSSLLPPSLLPSHGGDDRKALGQIARWTRGGEWGLTKQHIAATSFQSERHKATQMGRQDPC